jgi:hypothetical protein
VNLCGQRIEKSRFTDQAQTDGASTGLEEKAAGLIEHRGSLGEVSHGSGEACKSTSRMLQ